MTQSEKQLLLKDLCARLPYKLHCRVFKLNGDIKENDDILYRVVGDNVMTLKSDKDECLMYYQIKPYLRPMSSMTEKERVEYRKAFDKDFAILEDSIDAPIAYEYSDGMVVRDKPLFNEIDWLNEKMFDYRGLIPMGLALEAPEGMYNTKTE